MFNEFKELTEKLVSFKSAVQNEAQTRSVLIDPILKFLGYDTSNPFEVITEYTCDVGTKKGEKVDYALLDQNKDVQVLIEAKDCKVSLGEKQIGQLFRYFGVSSAEVAILTNGVQYLFFTDTQKPNVMDVEPFFTFDISNFTEKEVETFLLFDKNAPKENKVRDYALTMLGKEKFRDFLIQQAINPSNNFIRFVRRDLGLTMSTVDAAKIICEELSSVYKDIIGDKELLKQKALKKSTPDEEVVEKVEKQAKQDKQTEQDKQDKQDTTPKLQGLVLLSEFTQKNSKGVRIKSILWGNKELEVNTWNSLLSTILDDLDLTKFTKDELLALDNKAGDAGWIRSTPDGMRASKEIQEGVFMETHGSTYTTLCRLKNLCDALKINYDDVLINLKEEIEESTQKKRKSKDKSKDKLTVEKE